MNTKTWIKMGMSEITEVMEYHKAELKKRDDIIAELEKALHRDRETTNTLLDEKIFYIKALQAKLTIAMEALNEIKLGLGPYSQDHHEHAANCVEAMKSVATEALAKIV